MTISYSHFADGGYDFGLVILNNIMRVPYYFITLSM